MVKEKDNLELWKKVESTDPKYTKEVGYGRKFTSINAQYQVMNATEQFGKYGQGWGIEYIDYETIFDLPHGEVLVLAKATFFYWDDNNRASFPISSTIKMVSYNATKDTLHLDDEWAKKIETDITTKALSKLGFNADVFLGRYDDNRYVSQKKEEYKKIEAAKPKKAMTTAQYKSAMEAVEKANEKSLPAIKSKIEKYPEDDRYRNLVLKGIENRASHLSKQPNEKV
jgi:hypothetical protein